MTQPKDPSAQRNAMTRAAWRVLNARRDTAAKWTLEQQQAVMALRSAGYGMEAIAAQLGITRAAIYKAMEEKAPK